MKESDVPSPIRVEQISRQIPRERFIFTSAQVTHLESGSTAAQTWFNKHFCEKLKCLWPDNRADTLCTHPATEAVIQQFSSTDDDEEEEQSDDCEGCSCWEESVCTLQTSIHWFKFSALCESQTNWTENMIWSSWPSMVLQDLTF